MGNAPVTALVRLNLVTPEFRVGARKVLTAASVPETAIYKHSYFTPGPGEIGFTDDRPMLAIASDSSRPQKLCKGKLGRSIAAGMNGRHDLGPNFLRDVIHLAPLPF